MRAFKKFGHRGFTLVELMIVVAIIGVLAALAIYGVRRYLATAKTSEAKNTIGAISRSAAAAYERETVVSQVVAEGSSSSSASHALCTSAGRVPAVIAGVKGRKYQPDSAGDYATGDSTGGWKCLKFQISQPQYYMYSYLKGVGDIGTGAAASTANGFEAGAQGDLDNDGVLSQFSRAGEVNSTTGTIRLASQVFVSNEFE